jgi:predicted amidohydrolase YtcJ
VETLRRTAADGIFPGMTISPAHASFTEDVLGSLEIGKRADFVVLSQDIMKVPVEAILSTEVRATVIDGRPVFGKV